MRKLEEGATFTVSYEDIQEKRTLKIGFYIVAVIVLLALGLIVFLHLIKPPVPRFMLDDISVDPVSNASLVVTLSSTNPSYTTNICYTKMSVGVRIERIFQSEIVFLGSTLQTTRERTPWTAVLAINKTNGSVGIIDGLVKDGDIVAHVNMQGKYGVLTNTILVTCPILNDLKVSKPCQVI